MNSSVDLTIVGTEQFVDDLDRIREEVLYNINATIAVSLDINITAELMRFFTDGLSTLYYNASFEALGSSVSGINDEQRMCAINDIFMHFFPSMEQTEIASLGRKLQQIKVAYDVARTVSVYIYVLCTCVCNNISYNRTVLYLKACCNCLGTSISAESAHSIRKLQHLIYLYQCMDTAICLSSLCWSSCPIVSGTM